MLHLILLVVMPSWAAPHSTEISLSEDVTYPQVRRLVQFAGREDTLKKMGPSAYKHLRDLMMSPEEEVEDRWKATIALAKIGGEDSVPDLQSTLSHNEWFMRSAGLLAMAVAQKQKAEEEAKKMMRSDPALLVRATALQVIAQNAKVDKEYLWSEIYNPINFNKGKSLPLRLSILKVLESHLSESDVEKLMALSREDNSDIKQLARSSLERVRAIANTAKKNTEVTSR